MAKDKGDQSPPGGRNVPTPRRVWRYRALCRRAHAFAEETEALLAELYPEIPLSEVVAWERVIEALRQRMDRCEQWLEDNSDRNSRR
jgi:hypothetical protein